MQSTPKIDLLIELKILLSSDKDTIPHSLHLEPAMVNMNPYYNFRSNQRVRYISGSHEVSVEAVLRKYKSTLIPKRDIANTYKSFWIC